MPTIQWVDLNVTELEMFLEAGMQAPLSPQACDKLKAVLRTLVYLMNLLRNNQTTIRKLRRMLFGATTEKTNTVLNRDVAGSAATTGQSLSPGKGAQNQDAGKKRKGHGRNSADAYKGAERIKISHPSLKPGDHCPDCKKGRVYDLKDPAVLVRLVGRGPIEAKVYEMEVLRCNLCSKVFPADPPEGVGPEKYDPTAGAMIALLKYGSGFPFHRLERLQGSVGIPLPASTQWGIVLEIFRVVYPAYKELIRQAAQGEVLYNDDTDMRILALMGKRARQRLLAESCGDSEKKPERTGIFTSGIVSTREGREIALFFTGRKYAGENLADVLAQRASELGPPIQMCDGLLSRNLPKEFEVILSGCNVHSRRNFVDVAPDFPDECRFVIETLRDVYANEAQAKEQGMPPDERLAFHQAQSGPLMDRLEKWLDEQIAHKKVEPNSALGQAIFYMKKHWTALTKFLHAAGAPLDNTTCERALKKAILHRKGSLFYKTQNGANVGDAFMSLIHTAERCGADPFDYLVQLQRNAAELAENPGSWMPWNYRETLERGRATPRSD